jgi:uncharacterized protein YqiB (DUF1249 family)
VSLIRKSNALSLSDPQSLTIATVANSLPRVETNGSSSVYQTSDGTVKLSVSTSAGKRKRTLVRVDHTKIAADPLTAVNQQVSMSLQLVADRPLTGYTVAQQQDIVKALVDYLSASTYANTTKILGGES